MHRAGLPILGTGESAGGVRFVVSAARGFVFSLVRSWVVPIQYCTFNQAHASSPQAFDPTTSFRAVQHFSPLPGFGYYCCTPKFSVAG